MNTARGIGRANVRGAGCIRMHSAVSSAAMRGAPRAVAAVGRMPFIARTACARFTGVPCVGAVTQIKDLDSAAAAFTCPPVTENPAHRQPGGDDDKSQQNPI